MIAKIVILFLVFIAVLGMFGKLRVPGKKQLDAKRCPKCGRFRIGKTCNCDRKG